MNKWFTRGIFAACTAAAIGVRYLVASSSPSFFPGGDSAEYVALSRELAANHFVVPAINSIYFPGTQWVVPPLPVYVLSGLMTWFGSSGMTSFLLVLSLTALFDLLALVPLWMLTKAAFGNASALLVSIFYVAYSPSLYIFSWTGYEQAIGLTLSIWALYFSFKICQEDSHRLRNGLLLGVVMGVTALSHDLTGIVIALEVGLIIAAQLVIQAGPRTRGARDFSLVRALVTAVVVASPFYLYWYAGRLQWALGAAGGQASGTSFTSTLTEYLTGLEQPLGPLFYFEVAILVPALFYGAYRLVRAWKTKSAPFFGFLVTPLVLTAVEWNNPTFSVLFAYYLMIAALPIAAYGLLSGINAVVQRASASPSTQPNTLGSRRKNLARWTGYFLLFLFVASTSVASVQFNMTSHTYFNECFECSAYGPSGYDFKALNWIAANVSTASVVAAPGNLSSFGFFICGYDGNPCLVAHGLKWLSQSSERAEASAAQVLIFSPIANETLTISLIRQYRVGYIVTPSLESPVPGFYLPVYHDDAVAIYKVTPGNR